MFVKVLIITAILVGVVVLVLGIKLLIDPKAEFSSHSCALDSGELDENGACGKCQLRDLADCPDKNKNEWSSGNTKKM